MSNHQPNRLHLPQLCQGETLLGLILLAELLVLVLVLAEPIQQGFDWSRLALTSLFVQWVVLLSAAILCRLQPKLQRISTLSACLLIICLVLSLTAACSAAAQLIQQHYFGLQLSNESQLMFYARNLGIALIMLLIGLRVMYLQAESRRQQQAHLQTRLEALQARMQPHFLFNTLNSITSLISLDSDKAEQAILDLSDLLRASLQHGDRLSCWQQEQQLAMRYLAIEKYRFAERLQVQWHTDHIPGQLPMPHLCLQPLLENAVIHGIEPSINGGTIHIEASYQNGWFTLQISNPLPQQPSRRQGSQIALDNTRLRLKSQFSAQAQLTTECKATEFVTTISYPCSIEATASGAPA